MTLVMLHGFLGIPESWSEVLAATGASDRVLRPALFGHGATEDTLDRAPATFEDEVDRIAARMRDERIGAAHWVGYSMGARVALVLAARHPDLVGRLTLVSGTAGLDDDDERRARAVADDRLADALRSDGLPAFVRRWEALPLFATQERLSAAVRARHRARRLSHRPELVARALEILSPGRMPVMTKRLGELTMPVTLVAGDLDAKFSAIARSIAPLFPSARVHIVDGAGHDPCLERPEAIAATLIEHGRTEKCEGPA